jgi:hypothetical protein
VHKGRDSSVGTAIRKQVERSGDQIPVAVRFSMLCQTGPGAQPGSYIMGTGSILGANRPGRVADHPLRSSAEVRERVEPYLYYFPVPSWQFIG